MKTKICKFVLSLVLNVIIIGFLFNVHGRFVPEPMVKEHKVIEAPILPPFYWLIQYWQKSFRGIKWSGYHWRFPRHPQPEG